jgi:hypothetical protein
VIAQSGAGIVAAEDAATLKLRHDFVDELSE